MPNGRSGGFPIETVDLKQLIAEIAGDAAIGILIRRASQPGPTTASEVGLLVDQFSHPRLAVEEQYGDSYIIHISNEPDFIWVGWVRNLPYLPRSVAATPIGRPPTRSGMAGWRYEELR